MAKKRKKKSDAATVAIRVEEVLRIRIDGAQFHDVVQYAAEKKWGIHDRQLRTYIRRADELLVERQDRSRRRVMARHLAQRQIATLCFSKRNSAGVVAKPDKFDFGASMSANMRDVLKSLAMSMGPKPHISALAEVDKQRQLALSGGDPIEMKAMRWMLESIKPLFEKAQEQLEKNQTPTIMLPPPTGESNPSSTKYPPR